MPISLVRRPQTLPLGSKRRKRRKVHLSRHFLLILRLATPIGLNPAL
jgi:hypothetical protein